MSNFYESEAFKALLEAIQQQYGPIAWVGVCNHTEPSEVALDDDEEELSVEYPAMEEETR